jgi:hypothetical protein
VSQSTSVVIAKSRSTQFRALKSAVLALALLAFATTFVWAGEPIPVNISNFNRVETDLDFGRTVKAGGFGKLSHNREMAPIDDQIVVRMNRDTLYSGSIFDLEAGPVTITLPDTGKRFMSMLAVSEDAFSPEVVYAPGHHTFTKENVGTRYVGIIIRTLANPQGLGDMKADHALQDAIKVEQARVGTFEVPNWDATSQDKAREALKALDSLGGASVKAYGTKSEVDPVDHLIEAAAGWGGNPSGAAIYLFLTPKENDGKTVYTLTVKDVPVDRFWSISVYNAEGFFVKNDLDAYSLNNLTMKSNPDGSSTVQFGGCQKSTANCLPTMPGWNYWGV